MNLDIDKRFIYQKIDEYIMRLYKIGLVTDKNLLDDYYTQLHNLRIREIFNAPGNARITAFNALEYCKENIIYGMLQNGEYYIDEVLFHEFSHVINSFHKALRGPQRFNIEEALEEKMNPFTNALLLKQEDKLLDNQNPYYGVFLLDEYVAQSLAQEIIKDKYNELSLLERHRYSKNDLSNYYNHPYTTRITKPPYSFITSLACYQEYDIPAQKFIMNYFHITNIEFIKRSINYNLFKNMVDNLDYEEAEELYIDLCYMGLIEEALSNYKGFINVTDSKDQVSNPKNIYKAYERILKK